MKSVTRYFEYSPELRGPGKICSKCEILRPIERFHKNKSNPDGFAYRCKACVSEDQRETYTKNKDKKNAKGKVYREANAERIRERHARYRRENRDELNYRRKVKGRATPNDDVGEKAAWCAKIFNKKHKTHITRQVVLKLPGFHKAWRLYRESGFNLHLSPVLVLKGDKIAIATWLEVRRENVKRREATKAQVSRVSPLPERSGEGV